MDDELKRLLDYVPGSSDPLTRWRQQSEQFEAEKREAQTELKAEEARRTAELQAATPEAWDAWLYAALSRHLLDHPTLSARFQGVGEAIGELVAELRGQIDKQRSEITELKLECARLAIKISEVQTDRVLAALPGLGTQRSTVN
jgi:hypothetical protein